MQSINELLNRIHRDPEFGRGHFEIGFYDRRQDGMVRIAFNEVTQQEGGKIFFHVFDEDNNAHCVPMHRVYELYKDGFLIWKRKP